MSRLYNVSRGVLAIAALVCLLHPSILIAQFTTPETFDINRFSPNGGQFETFFVTETAALVDVLRSNTVRADTRVLVTAYSDGQLALLTDQMSFHHIAQGEAGGQPWMVTF